MSVFGDYARYYNLLYQDKNYKKEVVFVLAQLRKCGCTPATILDLGCGTGRHAQEIARNGIGVTGVDMSVNMLDIGRSMLADGVESEISVPSLLQGDARNVRLGQSFDAVTSLFHVMSYQNSEEDALAEMETARVHLRRGGVFFFDFWYGPGVLSDPPTERVRIMEDAATLLQRHAHPVHRVNDNIVEVHYRIQLKDKLSNEEHELHEMHSMRYWFLPELRHLAKLSGFQVAGEGKWMEPGQPNLLTWNAWMALTVK